MPSAPRNYLVLATPRSGSTLLGQALNTTDLAGDPREYFGPKMRFWTEKWGTPSLEAFVARLRRERSTANGVFGAKLLLSQLRHLERLTRAEPRWAEAPLPAILAELFPGVRYLWIVRRDKTRQAISYWKAKETGIWGRDQAPRPGRTGQGRRARVISARPTGRTARYDYAGIAALRDAILADEAGIARFFADGGIAPLTIVYEEFVDRYAETTREALRFIGIAPPANLALGPPRTAQLADAETEEWVTRFEAERTASG